MKTNEKKKRKEKIIQTIKKYPRRYLIQNLKKLSQRISKEI